MHIKKNSSDFLINIVCNFIGALMLLQVISLIGRIYFSAALGLFLLIRQWGSVAGNLFQVGTSQTLLRYVPMYPNDVDLQFNLLFLNLAVIVGISLVFVFGCFFFQGSILSYFFHSSQNTNQLWVLVLLIISIFSNFNAFSFLISKRKFLIANLVNIMNTSGWMLLFLGWTILFSHHVSVISVLLVQAACTLLLSLFVIIVLLVKMRIIHKAKIRVEKIMFSIRRLYTYGLPRVLTPSLDNAMIAIGPWLVRSNKEQAGFLIMALIVVRFTQTLLGPIAQVISIYTASDMGKNNEQAICNKIKYLIYLSIVTGCLSYIVLFFLKNILVFWLHSPTLANNVYVFAHAFVFIMPCVMLFYSLRGVIDIYITFPINGVIIGFSLWLYYMTYMTSLHYFHATLTNAIIYSTVVMYVMLALFILTISCHILWNAYMLMYNSHKPFIYSNHSEAEG